MLGVYREEFAELSELLGLGDLPLYARMHLARGRPPRAAGSCAARIVMKLGLYGSIANPPRGDDLDVCVQDTLAEVVSCEQSSFDGFFFGCVEIVDVDGSVIQFDRL